MKHHIVNNVLTHFEAKATNDLFNYKTWRDLRLNYNYIRIILRVAGCHYTQIGAAFTFNVSRTFENVNTKTTELPPSQQPFLNW